MTVILINSETQTLMCRETAAGKEDGGESFTLFGSQSGCISSVQEVVIARLATGLEQAGKLDNKQSMIMYQIAKQHLQSPGWQALSDIVLWAPEMILASTST